MKLTEIYKTRQDRIQPEHMKEFKEGLTIKEVKLIGKKRMGILLSFIETDLEHKCNRTDAFALAEKFETDETDDFKGKKIFFKKEETLVRISFETKNNNKEK